MSTLPMSECVAEALLSQLVTITMSDGYHSDAGTRAARARRTWASADLPALSLFDGGESPDGATGSGKHDSMTMRHVFIVSIFAAAEQEDTGKILGLLAADVKKCLLSWSKDGGMRTALGTAAGPLIYVSMTPQPREEGGTVEGAEITFATIYQEGYGNPDAPI